MWITQPTALNPRPDVENDNDVIREHIEHYVKDLTLIKSLDWSNENEFRFEIFDCGSDDPVDVEFGDSLSEIVLGLKSETIHHPSVAHFAGDVSVFETDWNQTIGRLSKQPMSS